MSTIATRPAGGQPTHEDPPPRRRRGIDWRQVALAALLVVPNLALLVIFTYRPLLDNIRLSFYHWNIS